MPELTSERTRVLANPNGTFTAELSATQARVRRADGSWSAVDTDLQWSGDGIVPKASPLQVRLSGGGAGPLFALTENGRTLSYGWPGTLPKPLLSGDTATYPEVLPGVDLKVRPARDRIAQAFVVKTRAAAANPALRSIRMTLDGAEAFRMGEPRMWDSRRIADPVKRAQAEDPAEARRASEDFVSAPRTGAKVADVGYTKAPGELVLQPDMDLLTGQDTVYPVIIDPPVDLNYQWTMINARHSGQSYWTGDDRQEAKVGYVEDPRDGWEKYRTALSFDTRPLRGKVVNSGGLDGTLNYSYNSANTEAKLFLVAPIGPGTTWDNHQASWTEELESTPMAARNGPKHVEWRGDRLLGKLRQSAQDWDTITLGLISAPESSINTAWKKFDPNKFVLHVEYNSYPDAPRDIRIDEITSCVKGDGRPATNNLRPTLKAIASDPDGGTLSMQARFGEIGPDGKYDVENGKFTYYAQSDVRSGSQGQLKVDQLTSGRSYWFFLVNKDPQLWSERSPICEFTVDTTAPDKKPAISSADGMYPNDGKVHGGVGKTGRFTFGSNGSSDNGVNDVTGYRYGFTQPPVDFVKADKPGGSATAGVTPENRNLNRLFVQSVDRAGNTGPTETYEFWAGRGTAPIGQWNLDEKSGSTLADGSGGNRPATLSGGTAFTDSLVGGGNGAVNFNGRDGSAATGRPVIESGTNFSVTAWVRMTADGTAQTVVAQDGERASGLYLQYSKSFNRWSFTVTAGDSDGTDGTQVVSDQAPRLGVWTHLAGTFDAANKVARLYVNAREVGKSEVPNPWSGAGATTIGRAKWQGRSTDYFTGDIDDVRIWDRRIYESEIAEIADQPTLVGQWDFDEQDGSTAADSSGFGRPLSMKDGATFTSGHSGNAGSFGGKAYADAGKPVLRTENSFTIAARVKINNLDATYTVLGQDGNRTSPFLLQYQKTDNRWVLCLMSPDGDGPSCAKALTGEPPKIGEWVHLTGVYDVRLRQVRLYLNGKRADVGVSGDLWQAGGAFTVGRGKWQGKPTDFFPGAIDEVRVYQGVLSESDIFDLGRA
ncbi:LamG domain-containing protein [Pseudonocardiaceae bacterium YIM PH 21723]|nr:LamG domain-containing protein [Pseudonocardiaceae bacterium YIM PH 21723]